MFVFISHLEVPEEDRSRLEGHFRNRARLVDGFPGFIRMQLLRPESGEASFTVLTVWSDREAFQLLMDSGCEPQWLGD